MPYEQVGVGNSPGKPDISPVVLLNHGQCDLVGFLLIQWWDSQLLFVPGLGLVSRMGLGPPTCFYQSHPWGGSLPTLEQMACFRLLSGWPCLEGWSL